LAITQVLLGYRGILIARARVRFYMPALAWGGLILLITVQAWWAMFGMQHHEQWTFLQFVVVLLQAILLYLLAALVFPDVPGEARIDLRVHYFEQATWFFGFGLALLIVSVLKDLVVTGGWPSPLNLTFHAIFFALWLVAARTRREGFHRLLPLLMLLAFSIYIVELFGRL
jgi:hypothetical protein